MKCEEFQQSINRGMDGELRESPDAALLEHAEHCQECAVYRAWLWSLDADLRQLSAVHIPQELLQKLGRIPKSSPRPVERPAWKPELVRLLAYGIPGIVAALFIARMPGEVQMIGNFLLAFVGVFVFFLSLLRPIFLSPNNSGEGR